jgi:peptidoglycan hydrolase-like protein with peptidoglycan-binding domain
MLRRGDRGAQVRAIQEALNRLGQRYVGDDGGGLVAEPLAEDGIFGARTEGAVVDFQEMVGIPADGIVGPVTLGAIERAIARQEVEQTTPGVDSLSGTESRLPFVRCPADAHAGGYNRFWLRADVSEAYLKTREQLERKGAIITSSGARRW